MTDDLPPDVLTAEPADVVAAWLERAPRELRGTGVDTGLGIEVRRALWARGVPFVRRERIAHLATWWPLPWTVLPPEALEHACREACILAPGEVVAAVAAGQGPGRSAAESKGALAAFRETCELLGCWSECLVPERSGRGTGCVVLVGLPGVGKDSWLRGRWSGPVLSLDALREELGVSHDDEQRGVLDAAWRRVTAWLEARTPFAWNATNLRRRQRAGLVSRLKGLGASVTLVNLDAAYAEVRRRNRHRAGAVPEKTWEKLLGQWEPVWPGEADAEQWFEDGVEVRLEA